MDMQRNPIILNTENMNVIRAPPPPDSNTQQVTVNTDTGKPGASRLTILSCLTSQDHQNSKTAFSLKHAAVYYMARYDKSRQVIVWLL
jgi:hypothetical protein